MMAQGLIVFLFVFLFGVCVGGGEGASSGLRTSSILRAGYLTLLEL